jgi:hypothetical protein
MDKGVLKLYSELWKEESLALVQAHTGHVGLAKFLYCRRMLGVLYT